MIRTTGTGRFTPGIADATMVPSVGSHTTGRPPLIFMTGGAFTAADDPTVLGIMPHLTALCDDGGWAIMQPSVGDGSVMFLGNDTSMARIDDAADYARANFGATADPPCIFGLSNGWVCGIIYARQFSITAVGGILPASSFLYAYQNNDPDGATAQIEDAWGVTSPTLPPARFSPVDDVANYPSLVGRIKGWYACNDYLFVADQMAFLTQIQAEQVNLGGYPHIGTIDNPGLAPSHVDPADVVEFFGRFA